MPHAPAFGLVLLETECDTHTHVRSAKSKCAAGELAGDNGYPSHMHAPAAQKSLQLRFLVSHGLLLSNFRTRKIVPWLGSPATGVATIAPWLTCFAKGTICMGSS